METATITKSEAEAIANAVTLLYKYAKIGNNALPKGRAQVDYINRADMLEIARNYIINTLTKF